MHGHTSVYKGMSMHTVHKDIHGYTWGIQRHTWVHKGIHEYIGIHSTWV